MDIKKFRGRYSSSVEYLYSTGVSSYPIQVERVDLEYDEGIDIVFRFKRMTPSKFRELSDLLLIIALEQANRYEGIPWKFAKLEVELNRTAKGRKTIGPRRDYIAAKDKDAEVMVYGEDALGYLLPEGAKKPYLINKIEEILDIPDSPSPGPYISKQNPYKVISMTIAIRAGLKGKKRLVEE